MTTTTTTDQPAAKKTARAPRFTPQEITAAVRNLKSGKPVKVAPHPTAKTGAYKDPYVCAYYPVKYMRDELAKAGTFTKDELKIRTTRSESGVVAELTVVTEPV